MVVEVTPLGQGNRPFRPGISPPSRGYASRVVRGRRDVLCKDSRNTFHQCLEKEYHVPYLPFKIVTTCSMESITRCSAIIFFYYFIFLFFNDESCFCGLY